jgi:homoserine dehydrogenase
LVRADLALIGFGNVARCFVSLLDERREWLVAHHGLECRIVAIATARHGAVWKADGLEARAAVERLKGGGSLPDLQVTHGASRLADSFDAIGRVARSTADLRIVVETTTLDIRAGQPAIDHVTHAMDGGCDVVTANKGPAAFAYDDLQRRAHGAGVSFLFEGAVMDGIPLFNLVRETLPAVRILGFRGVVNSTTNHILTALEDGEAFAPALARMQADGIAEADPSLDVDGWDAAAKAAALANVLMNARTTPHHVDRTGIGPSTAVRAVEAKRQGRRLRLVASAQRDGDEIRVVVRPVELPKEDLLAGLRGMANALVLQTDVLGEIAICQFEGGLTQTAYALFSDIMTVARRRQSPGGAQARRIP